jgi:t-SNARE complex subunit (syntaxin)
MESQKGNDLAEEKFYLAVNDNLMNENKRLKRAVFHLEHKLDRCRWKIRILIAICIIVVLICTILFYNRGIR